MTRLATVLLVIAWLGSSARAQTPTPLDPPAGHPDPNAAHSPWIDIGHPKLVDPQPGGDVPQDEADDAGTDDLANPTGGHPVAASLTLGGFYGAFVGWTYFAWYRHHKALSEFKWGGDGYFSRDEYAGGSDKLGHAWATMGLARITAETLNRWGGYSRLGSAIVGAALADALFLGVEVKDGFYYEFSYGDFLFDSIGAVAAFALTMWPRLDELFDYRVQYWPSSEYRAQLDHGNVNIAEDYSGEIYLAALHLGAIHTLSDRPWGAWSKFVDVAVGFGTRGYKPDEPSEWGCPSSGDPRCYTERQNLYIGVSLNAQGVLDYFLGGRSEPARKVGHALFEMFNAPETFVPVKKWSRTGMGAEDGA